MVTITQSLIIPAIKLISPNDTDSTTVLVLKNSKLHVLWKVLVKISGGYPPHRSSVGGGGLDPPPPPPSLDETLQSHVVHNVMWYTVSCDLEWKLTSGLTQTV